MTTPFARALRTILALLTVCASTVGAQLSNFTGTWKNIDAGTRSITMLRVDLVGIGVKVQAWSKCAPADCPWGEVEGIAYASEIGADISRTARVVSARFATQFSEVLLIVRLSDKDRVQVEVLKRYTDHSGRANVSEVATLERAGGSS
jgi:hypothetical protein